MYLTFYKTKYNKLKQQTLGDIWNELEYNFDPNPVFEAAQKLITIKTEGSANLKDKIKPDMYDLPEPPMWDIEDNHNHYYSFKIPKKSGGLRQIDAPDDNLKVYLTELKLYFEETLKIIPHDAAHAYVKERSTLTAVKTHQQNESHWFLKLDFHDFFGSHNLDYTMRILKEIYPLSYMLENQDYERNLRKALSYGFLNGRLPQGTPLSPTLTNIMMMPLDYAIQHWLWDQKNGYIYTRYADDLLISSKYKFLFMEIQNGIINILNEFNAPFNINKEKTRYGSRAGSNWNLGLMLNQKNDITIGRKKAKVFKACINNLLRDYKNGKAWPTEDLYELSGLISYYRMVEADYINFVINRLETKYNLSVKEILHERI